MSKARQDYRNLLEGFSSGKFLIDEERGLPLLTQFFNDREMIKNGVTPIEIYGSRSKINPRYARLINRLNNQSDEKKTDFRKTDFGSVEDIHYQSHTDYIVKTDDNGVIRPIALNKRMRNFEEVHARLLGISMEEYHQRFSEKEIRDDYEDEDDYSEGVEKETNDDIKVIRHLWFVGGMTKYGGWSTKGIEDLSYELQEAYDDEKVCAVVLEMDTPGGSAQAAEMLRQKLLEKNKPVVVSAINLLSGGMWSCCVADHIEANGEIADFGSIGVYITMYSYEKYLEKEGVKEHSVYASKSTNKNRGYRDALKGQYKYLIEQDLDPMNNKFHSIIENSLNPRGLEWNTGKVFPSDYALQIGLCHGIGNLSTAILKAKQLSDDMKEDLDSLDKAMESFYTATASKEEGAGALVLKSVAGISSAQANLKTSVLLSVKEVSELKNSKAVLEQKVDDLTAELAEAKKSEGSAKTEGETLTVEMKAANDKIVSDLQAEVQQLKTEKATSDTTISELKTKVTALAGDVTKAKQRTKDIIDANNLGDVSAKEGGIQGEGLGKGEGSSVEEDKDKPKGKVENAISILQEATSGGLSVEENKTVQRMGEKK